MNAIAFFDLEPNTAGTQLRDMSCVLSDGSGFHKNQPNEFEKFIEHTEFICGHNIIAHDLAFLQKHYWCQ